MGEEGGEGGGGCLSVCQEGRHRLCPLSVGGGACLRPQLCGADASSAKNKVH